MTEQKTKRPYTMTPAALAQRRANAENATGPTTEEGKAIASRNSWKHGLRAVQATPEMRRMMVGTFLKPCKSTCPMHPDNSPDYPCQAVMEGQTQPGGDCLDKTVYLQAFNDIIAVMKTGDPESMHVVMAGQVAGAIEVLQNLRECVATDGILVKVPMATKAGDVYGYKHQLNPALPQYIALLEKLGLSLPELMLTPKAVAGRDEQESAENAIAELFGRALSRAGGGGPVRRPPRVFEGEAE